MYAYEAQARKAGEEATNLKQAADGATELQKSLSQERERAGALEQELVAARRDLVTQTALTKKAEEVARDKQAAEGNSAELQKSLRNSCNVLAGTKVATHVGPRVPPLPAPLDR